MKKEILLTWLGKTDIKNSYYKEENCPILRLLKSEHKFDEIYILFEKKLFPFKIYKKNTKETETVINSIDYVAKNFISYLKNKSHYKMIEYRIFDINPTHYEKIFNSI
jgi:hypothetical protein